MAVPRLDKQELARRRREVDAWVRWRLDRGLDLCSAEARPASGTIFELMRRADEGRQAGGGWRSMMLGCEETCNLRRQQIVRQEIQLVEPHGGRWARFDPSCADYIQMAHEPGFVDEADAPGWDVWVAALPAETDKLATWPVVLLWIPAPLVSRMEAAIGCSVLRALDWVDFFTIHDQDARRELEALGVLGLKGEDRTDQQLVAAINRGDWSAFEPLYFRHRDWVYRLACRFAGEHAAALDVVQEAFAYLLAQFPGFVLTAKMTTYLYPVVKNTALASKRRSKRLKFGEVPEVEAAPVVMPQGELGELLKVLPDGQLEVLLMRVVDGMSVEEVAAALGLAEGTVKSRLHHALEKLRGDERAKKWFGG